MASNPLQDAMRKRQQEIERENRRDPLPPKVPTAPPPPPPSLPRAGKTIERDNARKERVRQRVELRSDARLEAQKRQIAAEAARAAREAEAARRAAEIRRRTNRLLARASARSEKAQERIAKIEESVDIERANIDRQLEVLKIQQNAALSGGNVSAVRELSKQANILANKRAELSRGLMQKKQALARFYATTKLGLATVGVHERLTPEMQRERVRQRAGAQPTSVEEMSLRVPGLYDLVHSPLASGAEGRSAQIVKASKQVNAYFEKHPEEYDSEVVLFVADELARHAKAVNEQNQEAVDDASILLAEINKAKPGSRQQRFMVKRLNRIIKEYKLDGVQKELRFLYGPPVKTTVKGRPLPRKNVGFVTEFANDADRIYDLAQQRANDIWAAARLSSTMYGRIAEMRAGFYYDAAEATRKDIYDPVTGSVRKQTVDERLAEMFASGQLSEGQMKAAGQDLTVDWRAESVKWANDPILKHLSPVLEASEVEDNYDLTGGLNKAKIDETVVPMATQAAMDEWLATKPVPAGTAEGIYDASRYGRDEQGEYFLLADGTLVRPGMPMPAGHPEPKWGALPAGGGSVVLAPEEPLYLDLMTDEEIAAAAADQTRQFAPRVAMDLQAAYHAEYGRMVAVHRQFVEDTLRNALKVPDPGFFGDVLGVPVIGPVFEIGAIAAGGVSALADKAFRGDFGLSVSFAADYKPLFEREKEKYQGWIVRDADGTEAEALSRYAGYSMQVAYESVEDAKAGRGVFTAYLHIGGAGGFVVEISGDMTTEALEREEASLTSFGKAVQTGNLGVIARVAGEQTVVQVGNMAGLFNFLTQMFYDPTNFIPFAAIGKAGLRGVKAAVGAGKLPAASPLARLSNIVDAFRGEMHISPVVTELAEINKFVKQLPVGASNIDRLGAFRAALADMDPLLKGDAAADALVDGLMKELGLTKLGFDPSQLRHWAYREIDKVLLQRGWIIHTKSEDVALTLEKMEQKVKDAIAQQAVIDADIAKRNAAVIAAAKRKGEEAERLMAAERSASETLEREALTLADHTSVRRLEEMMVAETDPAQKAILERAVQLKRERIGGTAAGGAIGTGGRRISLDPAAIAAEEARIAAEEAAELAEKVAYSRTLADEAVERANEAAARFAREEYVREAAARSMAAPGSPPPHTVSLSKAPGGARFIQPAPAEWTSKTGRAFWTQEITEGMARPASDFATTAVRVNQFLEGVRARFGRWEGTPARKAFVNLNATKFLNRAFADISLSENEMQLRQLHQALLYAREPNPFLMEPQDYVSFEAFGLLWETRGTKSPVTVYGPEFMDAYEATLIASSGIPGGSVYERTLQFAATMEFGNGSMARFANFYLDDIANHFPEAFDEAKVYVAGLFKDDLDTLLQRIANTATDLRTEEFRALLDTDLNKLALRLHGPMQDPIPFSARVPLPVPRTAAQLINYDGASPAAMLSQMETWMAKAGNLDFTDTKAVDELARMVAYQAMTSDRYELAAEVAATLGRARVGTKGHAAAVYFREQMNREIDFLGYVGSPLAVTYDELAPLAAGTTRVFRGIAGTRGSAPSMFFSDGGSGGRAYGRGLYMTPDFTMADGYAYGPGYTGVVGSFTIKNEAVLDFTYFRADEVVWDTAEQIKADAAELKRIAPHLWEPIHDQELRTAHEMQDFMQKVHDEAVAAGATPDPNWRSMTGKEFFETHMSSPDLWEAALAKMNKGAMTFDTSILHRHAGMGNVQTIIKDPSYLSAEKNMVVHAIPYRGVDAARRATVQTAALLNEMGMSEMAWLQNRLARNAARIMDPKTTRTQRRLLMDEQLRIKAAQKHIRVRKGQDAYTVPRTSYRDALNGAESVRSRVRDVLPQKSLAHYAETPEQADVELIRDIHVALKSNDFTAPAIRELDDALAWFPVTRYAELNDFVGQAIQKVQGKRRSSLGLRGPLNDELGDSAVRTIHDGDPLVLQAKKEALDAWAAREGLSPLSVEAYDAMRTVLQPYISRNIRTKNLINEVRAMSGDYTENFLARRALKAEQNGVDNVQWTLLENPGMTVDEAATQFELSWFSGPGLKRSAKLMSESHERLLKRFFEETTGKSLDDQEGVKAALSAHGTKPPWDKKYSFRDHMTRIGEWSPRQADQIDETSSVWSLDQEREWFEARFGQAPAWVTDPRLQVGGDAFKTRQTMYDTLVDTGNYNEQLRIQARLSEDAGNDVKTLAFGDESRGIKPVKDWEQERAWAVGRYGDRVGKVLPDGSIELHAMPWLMTEQELARYVMSGVDDVGEVIWKAEDVAKLKAAMGTLAYKYVNQFEKALGVLDKDMMIIPSSAVHELSYHMMTELGVTTPWKTLRERLFRNRNLLDVWSAVWTGMIIGSPAWIASNLVDNPSKALAFSHFNFFARRASQEAIDLIPSVKALGINSTGFFEKVADDRGFWTRMSRSTSYGNLDRARAMWDVVTLRTISKPLVSNTEMSAKGWLARRIFTGLREELTPALKAQGMDDETIKAALLWRTKKQIEALFPSLDHAGVAERILNKVFPFVSYNFKNQIVWLTAVADHPWIIDVVQGLQGALIEYNRSEWAKDHPGEQMPEWLFSQIRIPGTDMFLDISMFSDSARGARMLTTGKVYDVQKLLYSMFRVLPSQQAALADIGYRLFGLFGRQRWEKVYDENGFWDGKSMEMVTVPPGTPWGDKPVDWVNDFIWVPGFANTVDKALSDGSLSWVDVLRIGMKLVTFGEVSEPSRYFMLNQQYFLLQESNPLLAENWLNTTEEGAYLKQMWDAQHMGPTDTGLPPWAFTAASNPHPSALDIQKMWTDAQSPEMGALFNDAWKELEWAKEYWDERIDSVPAGSVEAERLWALRRTWYTEYYGSHPYLWYRIGMGMNPTEYINDVGKIHQDDMVGQFKALFDWDNKPEDPKLAKQWEKDREEYLVKNPEVAAALLSESNGFDRAVNDLTEHWDKAFALSKAVEKFEDIAYELKNEKYLRAAEGVRQMVSQSLETEAIGLDPESRTGFRVKADMLTMRLRKAAGDPEAEAEIYYGERLAAVRRKAGKDPLKWHEIMDANPDLRQQYFDHNPEKALTWVKQGRMLKFWDRFGRLADKGHWDAAWGAWDELPEGLKDYWKEQNPKGYKEFVQTARYSAYMSTWYDLFGTKGRAAAFSYFDNLPTWVKERYYADHPGSSMSSGQHLSFYNNLQPVFDLIDQGKWDEAESVWNKLPKWQRDRYYQLNPDSTLFRGKYYDKDGNYIGGSGSGSSGGPSLSDAQFRQYMGLMKHWVALMKDGKDAQADDYFRSMPSWAQEFYLARNPDKALLKESDRMLAILETYFLADPAHQKAMLNNNPQLVKWLKENDAKTARASAIQYLYSELPDDPWLKRVFREKYPEIFSDEAEGKATIEQIRQLLMANPRLLPSWQRWMEKMHVSMIEAMKYITPRPKTPEVDHEYERQAVGHEVMSAAEVAEDVRSFPMRQYQVNKRLPRIEVAPAP